MLTKRGSELLLITLLAACSSGGSGSSNNAGPIHADATSAAPILVKYCSRCHAAPSAKEHTRGEWPSVIERMNEHRLGARLPLLKGADKQAVLAYLQSNAKE